MRGETSDLFLLSSECLSKITAREALHVMCSNQLEQGLDAAAMGGNGTVPPSQNHGTRNTNGQGDRLGPSTSHSGHTSEAFKYYMVLQNASQRCFEVGEATLAAGLLYWWASSRGEL